MTEKYAIIDEKLNGDGTTTFTVQSSDGTKTYQVFKDGDTYRCRCDGFFFKGKCSHIGRVMLKKGLVVEEK